MFDISCFGISFGFRISTFGFPAKPAPRLDCNWQLTTGNLRRGFSFTEILFAVMILAIGFIMVRRSSRWRLQQAKNSTEETIAAPIARGLAVYLGQLLSDNGKRDQLQLPARSPRGNQLCDCVADQGPAIHPPARLCIPPSGDRSAGT